MCMTSEPAKLSKTILYAGEAQRNDKLVHVLGYQNTAQSLVPQANAMLLPFPAKSAMGPENVIDTSTCKSLLKDMAEAIKLKRRSRQLLSFDNDSLCLNNRSVQVFNSGQYTVVLAENAKDIPSAMDRVRPDRRPKTNQELFDSIAELYPDWPVALCCWNSREMIEAEPMLWWYEPLHEDELFAPALDAHDGGAPKLGNEVLVDHTVILGSVSTPMGVDNFKHKYYPKSIKNIIPSAVFGKQFGGGRGFFSGLRMKNGDFVVKKSDVFIKDKVSRGSIEDIARRPPKEPPAQEPSRGSFSSKDRR